MQFSKKSRFKHLHKQKIQLRNSILNKKKHVNLKNSDKMLKIKKKQNFLLNQEQLKKNFYDTIFYLIGLLIIGLAEVLLLAKVQLSLKS